MNKRLSPIKYAVCISSAIAIITISILIIFIVKYNNLKAVETSTSGERLYSLDEVNSLIDNAVNTAVSNNGNSILEDLKSQLSGGTSISSYLRTNFPENIIYYDKDHYEFAPILDSVPKHNLNKENFSVSDSNEVTYSENGTVISHKGIDVSKYQGNINWSKVKNSGVEYAIIRMGYRTYGSGVLTEDTSFKANIVGATNNGIKAGVYFFSQAINNEEAVEEAQYVIDNIKSYNIDYPVVIDVESILNDTYRQQNLTKEELTNICISFCDTIKSAGYTPMIYANLKYFISMLDLDKLTEYEKWFAYYDTELYFPYDLSIWQYTDSGTVDGINGKVDLNISFKDWN